MRAITHWRLDYLIQRLVSILYLFNSHQFYTMTLVGAFLRSCLSDQLLKGRGVERLRNLRKTGNVACRLHKFRHFTLVFLGLAKLLSELELLQLGLLFHLSLLLNLLCKLLLLHYAPLLLLKLDTTLLLILLLLFALLLLLL